MNRLKDKRALVTGGSSGIGFEAARQFLSEGAKVAITGTNPKTLEAAGAKLGRDVVTIRADAGAVSEQKAVADTVQKAFGGLDVLFVNAGIAELKPIELVNEADFDRTISTNLKGPYFLIRALLPLFANPTSIVLNTSINARIGMPNTTVYAASKAGLASLARTLSGELITRGIRVNAVSPGPIATPIYGKLGLSEEDLRKTSAAILQQVPAARFGEPSEIAKAVVFLASDESKFTVGSELVIDGGMSNL